jgi:hypothetical protein
MAKLSEERLAEIRGMRVFAKTIGGHEMPSEVIVDELLGHADALEADLAAEQDSSKQWRAEYDRVYGTQEALVEQINVLKAQLAALQEAAEATITDIRQWIQLATNTRTNLQKQGRDPGRVPYCPTQLGIETSEQRWRKLQALLTPAKAVVVKAKTSWLEMLPPSFDGLSAARIHFSFTREQREQLCKGEADPELMVVILPKER